MIFSKLFKKKKWLSEKVSERLIAVAELNVEDSANKSIFHELAFNDADEKVRRATLEKLNDFSLWWQAFKSDASEMVRKTAEKILVDALTGQGTAKLDETLKRRFIEECTKTQLLEKVIFDLDDEALIIDTINRLNKEHLYFKAITESSLPSTLKQRLIGNIEEISQLKKLSKKLTGELLEQVVYKISSITKQLEKPVKIEKQARLLLAQLNALKDKTDFELVNEKQEKITHEWQAIVVDFNLLADETVSELTSKFDSINDALERIQAPIKQAWLAQQAEIELANTQQNNFDSFTQKLSKIESTVTQSIADDKDIEQAEINIQINDVSHEISDAELSKQGKSELLTRIESIFNRATKVPQIKAAIVKASQLLKQFKQLSLPSDLATLNQVNPEFKSLRNEWQANLKDVGIAMPTAIDEEYQALFSTWQPVIAELEKEQRKLFSQTRRKLSELEGLVSRGKFHSAFGLYKKLTFWIADLNEYYLSQIDRKWEQLEQDVNKLRELEQSFSAPKKQELIADIKKLAESPLADPTEQAHRVRLLRSNWQSLSHTSDNEEKKAEEQQLNEEFNNLCEQAFTTCREYYKQLEDERNTNLEAKLIVIEQLETLAKNLQQAEVQNWREVESLFVKLNKLWRETGLVDREKVADMNNRYHAAVKLIKKAISEKHSENEVKKRQFIEQAKKVVEQDIDVSDKSEQLKALQSKWQKVGFAGRKVDQKLWNEFRAINNPIFEQRDSSKKQEQEAAQLQFEQYSEFFSGLQQQLSSESELTSIRSILEQSEGKTSELTGLPRNLIEKLKKQHQAIVKEADNKISKIRKLKEHQVFVDLFNAIEVIAQGSSADLIALKPAWQAAINATTKDNRRDITLKLELSAGIDSPTSDKVQRNQVQMQMMSEKLEQGIEYSQLDLLEQWLSAGIFTDSDIELLKRIKPVFVS